MDRLLSSLAMSTQSRFSALPQLRHSPNFHTYSVVIFDFIAIFVFFHPIISKGSINIKHKVLLTMSITAIQFTNRMHIASVVVFAGKVPYPFEKRVWVLWVSEVCHGCSINLVWVSASLYGCFDTHS